MDVDAEREQIRWEIEELKRSLEELPSIEVNVSDTSLESGSNDEEDTEDDDESNPQADTEGDPRLWNGDSEGDVDLPRTPDTCLQMNLVYQEVIQEKIEEINLLLAQNKEHQEKLTCELSGSKGTRSGDGKVLPANMFLGHFMKPYFKDKTSGVGPPANSDAREKARQGIKSFEELITIKWKTREKQLLRQSVASDSLHRLLQPKLLKLDYLNGKRAKTKDDVARQIFDKQIQETEREIRDINLLPEGALLGNRFDKRDWEKIANINFEGTRNAPELRKFWQNSEHPSISKREWGEEEIQQLQEVAARHSCLDWQAIAQELGTQRSAFQCLQMFQAHHKAFKRSEWTPEEDQMLLQLVQDMRVGGHIPYRKIAYYMEGRDSAQLIYRWTKRVDPQLKRGAWTPEEDALLLKAVAKYGQREWYKIRTEVPGRTDLQCRDRYLNSLHYDIKKGKWSEEEERKLVELTEKYGTGRWAKIASELPHRSGSQCLSKWKVLLGYRKNRSRKWAEKKPSRKRRASPRPVESSSSSGGGSEDSELDPELDGSGSEEEEPKGRPAKAAAGQWRVPGIDLWVPTRKGPAQPRPGELASVTLLSKGFDENRKRKPLPSDAPADEGEGPLGTEAGASERARVGVEAAAAEEKEASAKSSSSRRDSWKVSLAYVKSVLRRETFELQKRSRELHRRRRFDPGRPAGRAPRGNHRGPPAGQWKMTLYRRLMIAVTPWTGSTVQALALRAKEEASRRSKAELIFQQLQAARLASTPLFTLFIQAAPARDANAQPSLQLSKKFIPLRAKEGPGAPPHPWQALLAPRPPQKPKTVSELLRAKRLREAEAKKAAQKRLLLAPRLLLPAPALVLQQPAVAPIASPAARLAGPTRAQALPALASLPPHPSPGSSCPPRKETAASNERDGPESARPRETQAVQAADGAPRWRLPPEQAQLPLQLSVAAAPRPVASGSKEGPCPGPRSPASSVPTQGASQPGSRPILPLTWVLSLQDLLPLALVSVPPPGKQPPGTPGTPPDQGPAAEAPLPKTAAPSTAPLATQPGVPSPGAPSSSLLKEGGPQQTEVSLPPAAPQEAQSRLPTACPPAPPSRPSTPPPVPPSGSAGWKRPPQPHRAACPPAPPPREEKVAPDYRLISLEEAAAVKKWALGEAARAPAPGSGLPYLPPFLSSLRTLSALLLHKEALEGSAASLVTPALEEEEAGGALRAAVQRQLRENPAYRLLRARFLAAFTFPAALATLPPFRVTTTLSGAQSNQEGDSSLSEEEEEEETEGAPEAHQGPGTERAAPDGLGPPGIRRSTRLRKRRRRWP
ncbi:snRNA-activating protein complex subunit 4 isoform X2 [Hemicordylus capensis]|uniref:snRNA-activating protein complex subunit 4 isoform X2 n=1 Tax=Hemicordylus capensis TaxID=884348 RepID=UPI0023041E49|nr:snRNA-activating protein complex subunit 4 isoform X2 [Hemicordylus capensis]